MFPWVRLYRPGSSAFEYRASTVALQSPAIPAFASRHEGAVMRLSSPAFVRTVPKAHTYPTPESWYTPDERYASSRYSASPSLCGGTYLRHRHDRSQGVWHDTANEPGPSRR
eukprot:scaffold1058_cov362-Prasinococcus_capsulatus_cf.AAC.14